VKSCINALNATGTDASIDVVHDGTHAWDLGIGFPTTDVILQFFRPALMVSETARRS